MVITDAAAFVARVKVRDGDGAVAGSRERALPDSRTFQVYLDGILPDPDVIQLDPGSINLIRSMI